MTESFGFRKACLIGNAKTTIMNQEICNDVETIRIVSIDMNWKKIQLSMKNGK
jgi:hypothetical protein